MVSASTLNMASFGMSFDSMSVATVMSAVATARIRWWRNCQKSCDHKRPER
jgi:hypothetical protein